MTSDAYKRIRSDVMFLTEVIRIIIEHLSLYLCICIFLPSVLIIFILRVCSNILTLPPLWRSVGKDTCVVASPANKTTLFWRPRFLQSAENTGGWMSRPTSDHTTERGRRFAERQQRREALQQAAEEIRQDQSFSRMLRRVAEESLQFRSQQFSDEGSSLTSLQQAESILQTLVGATETQEHSQP